MVSERSVSLGQGRRVPYAEPTSEAASRMGRANRRADSKPEVAMRSALHRAGMRFRKDLLVRAGDVRVRPDVVFTKRKVAVFMDGCFWHGCPDHLTMPKSNRGYWVPKLEANVARDHRVNAALGDAGWAVVRAWEHEPVGSVVQRVAAALSSQTVT